MKKIIILSILITISFSAFSQKEVRKQLREGNKEYRQEKYTESEIAYRKALETNAQSTDAAYNLGNSLYKQGKYPEALKQYQEVTISDVDAKTMAATYHNIGNIFMNQQDYAKSITAYKISLKNNPTDNETRYNLALAQKLLQNQQQNQDKDKQNQDKNKDKQDQDQNKDKQNQDQNKDKQNQDQNKDKQDQKDQNKDKQDQKDQQQQNNQDNKQDNKQGKTQQNQQQNEQMSPENAQQILDALLQNEKDTQDKVKEAQMRQIKTGKTDKDW